MIRDSDGLTRQDGGRTGVRPGELRRTPVSNSLRLTLTRRDRTLAALSPPRQQRRTDPASTDSATD